MRVVWRAFYSGILSKRLTDEASKLNWLLSIRQNKVNKLGACRIERKENQRLTTDIPARIIVNSSWPDYFTVLSVIRYQTAVNIVASVPITAPRNTDKSWSVANYYGFCDLLLPVVWSV